MHIHTYIHHIYVIHTSYIHHNTSHIYHTYIIHTYIHKYIHHTSLIHHTYITKDVCMQLGRWEGKTETDRQRQRDTHANVEAFLLLKKHWHIIFLFCEDEVCRLAV